MDSPSGERKARSVPPLDVQELGGAAGRLERAETDVTLMLRVVSHPVRYPVAMQRTIACLFVVTLAFGCGGDDGGDDAGSDGSTGDAGSDGSSGDASGDGSSGDASGDGGSPAECTPGGQGVTGMELTVEPRMLSLSASECGTGDMVLTSMDDVTAAFPAGAPAELDGIDFSADRVILGSSNPVIRFVVDDGTDLVAGEESLCQGVAPSCVAYVVRGTTRDSVRSVTCPYRGPDPCLAP